MRCTTESAKVQPNRARYIVAGELLNPNALPGWHENRLTPMFVLRNTLDQDRLYTAKPQVAVGAGTGEFLAFPSCTEQWPISSCAAPVTGAEALRPYSASVSGETSPVFGGAYYWPTVVQGLPTPRASFYVFTTQNSPYSDVALVPLQRFAFAEPCDWRDSAYATSAADASYLETTDFCPQTTGLQSYKFDGAEGFILSSCPAIFGTCNNFSDPTVPQPLYRRYSLPEQSYALILGSQLNNPSFSSYTSTVPGSSDVIGYVFSNIDSDGDGLIDGMEVMLGLNPGARDSDGNSVPDGTEYPMLTIF